MQTYLPRSVHAGHGEFWFHVLTKGNMPTVRRHGPSHEALILCPVSTLCPRNSLATHLECRITRLASGLRHEKLDFGYRHPIYLF